MSSEISEVVAGQVNERFLEVPTNSTYFADLATLNAAQSGAQNPFDAVVREVVDLRAAAGDMSAFDSRYVPIVNGGDRVWIAAQQFGLADEGTPALGYVNGTQAFLLDSAARELVQWSWYPPQHWLTWHLDIWWTNAGAGAGDVRFECYRRSFGDTENVGGNTVITTGLDITAPAQNIAKVSRITGSAVALETGEVSRLIFGRVGTNAADTLGNDCGILGAMMVRAS